MAKGILVVEDSLTQSERLRMLLQNAFSGHEVRVANNGNLALEHVAEQLPELVISDIVMPGMDGFTLCRTLKQDARFRRIPVMLLTSLADPLDIIRGLNAGTDFYLTKPYDDAFLVQKVSAILSQPDGPQQQGEKGWRVNFAGEEHVVHADLQQMMNLLLSTYENAVQQNRKLVQTQEELQRLNESLEARVAMRTREIAVTNQQLTVEVGERKRAEKLLQLQLRRVDALRQLDAVMNNSLDIRLFLGVLLEVTTRELEVDAAAVLLLKPLSLKLELAAARGLENAICTGDYALGPAGRAIRERNLVVVDGELPQEEDGGEGIRYKGFRSYAACPLTAKGKTLGVLEIFHRDALPQDGEWTQFFESLGRQAAIAIDGALLFEDVQRTNLELFAAYDSTLEGWSRALDLRDKETEGHSMRVTELSEQIARRLNMGPRDLAHLRRGALLHDIGKLAVPDAILRKPEPLLPEEREMMQMHPFHAYQMLSPISFLKESLDIPYCHHEKWDGTGYPRGLKGEQIPLAARIFAIADVWDALRSDRPYRKPWSRKRCLEHVVELSGTHFDPRVVDAFIAYYNECEGVVDPLPDVLEQH